MDVLNINKIFIYINEILYRYIVRLIVANGNIPFLVYFFFKKKQRIDGHAF